MAAELPKTEHANMHRVIVEVPNDHAGYDHECPICLVKSGTNCLNSKPGWVHRARMSVGRAWGDMTTGGDPVAPFLSFRYGAAEKVSCPVCKAVSGEECFTEKRLGGIHMQRINALT